MAFASVGVWQSSSPVLNMYRTWKWTIGLFHILGHKPQESCKDIKGFISLPKSGLSSAGLLWAHCEEKKISMQLSFTILFLCMCSITLLILTHLHYAKPELCWQKERPAGKKKWGWIYKNILVDSKVKVEVISQI